MGGQARRSWVEMSCPVPPGSPVHREGRLPQLAEQERVERRETREELPARHPATEGGDTDKG